MQEFFSELPVEFEQSRVEGCHVQDFVGVEAGRLQMLEIELTVGNARLASVEVEERQPVGAAENRSGRVHEAKPVDEQRAPTLRRLRRQFFPSRERAPEPVGFQHVDCPLDVTACVAARPAAKMATVQLRQTLRLAVHVGDELPVAVQHAAAVLDVAETLAEILDFVFVQDFQVR